MSFDFKIIATDFDGTLCVNKWPEIGEPNQQVLNYLKAEKEKGAKIILWTNRVNVELDAAVHWCYDHELSFDAVNANLPEVVATFGSDCRKIFAHEYIDDRASTKFCLSAPEEDGGRFEWARKEVELACEAERAGVKDQREAVYGEECYTSALEAFKLLCNQGHSGVSIQITKSLLNRLIDGKPLTPIEDVPEIWTKIETPRTDGVESFQCSRMTSLFKEVHPDGTITYSDVDRTSCVSVIQPDVMFHNSLATKFVDRLFPVRMPYLPSSKRFVLYQDECLFDPKNKSRDTVAFLYVVTPDGEKREINRYFKKVANQMVPIHKEEFDERKAVALRREA